MWTWLTSNVRFWPFPDLPSPPLSPHSRPDVNGRSRLTSDSRAPIMFRSAAHQPPARSLDHSQSIHAPMGREYHWGSTVIEGR